MRNSLLVILCSCCLCFSVVANAEGLPANPWAQQKSLKVGETTQSTVDDLADKTIDAATDMWSKVRNSEEFRQWKMPQKDSKTDNDEQSAADKEAIERQNLLIMLSKLNRVGYTVPSDYQSSMRKTYEESKAKGKASYDKLMREWQIKYNNTKNNTMNIVGRSYNRMLSSVKRSTGVDINRTINDTVNAFK